MIIDHSLNFRNGHFNLYSKWVRYRLRQGDESVFCGIKSLIKIITCKDHQIVFSSVNLVDRFSLYYFLISIFKPFSHKIFIVHSLRRRMLARVFRSLSNCRYLVFSDALKVEMEQLGFRHVTRVSFPNAYLLNDFSEDQCSLENQIRDLASDYAVIWGRSSRELSESQLKKLNQLEIPIVIVGNTHDVINYSNIMSIGAVTDNDLHLLLEKCKLSIMILSQKSEQYFNTRIAASGVYETNSFYGKITLIIGNLSIHSSQFKNAGDAIMLNECDDETIKTIFDNPPTFATKNLIKIEEILDR